MRKIKFRAWDGKEMHENVVIVDGKTYKRNRFGMIYAEGSKAGTPMQYTGLKDVNGEEIYEGDIVECFVNGNSYVSFKGGAYGLIFDDSFIPFSDVHGEMKVIGNIYEHPHLLKEVK